MVRHYKRKTQRGGYGIDMLKEALLAIQHGKPIRTASFCYNVPRRTLRRHTNQEVKHPGEVHLGGRNTTLSNEVELQIIQHVQLMERRLYGLTPKDVRRLAYQMAEHMNIDPAFNRNTGIAGTDWLTGFMSRLGYATPSRDQPCQGFGIQ